MEYVYFLIITIIGLFVLHKYHYLKIYTIIMLLIEESLAFIYYYINVNTLAYLNQSMMIVFFIVIFIVDLKEYWIPDLMVMGVGFINLLRIVENIFYLKNIYYSGMILCLIFGLIIILIFLILKKEMMGFGDIKLYFVLSIGLSISQFIILMLLSSVIGLLFIIILKKKMIPFGPSIILSYMILDIVMFVNCFLVIH